MSSSPPISAAERPLQFGLFALLQYVTTCAILAAASSATGILPAVFLAGFALALGARNGFLAIVALAFALLLADWPSSRLRGPGLAAIACTIVVALGLCGWYRFKSCSPQVA